MASQIGINVNIKSELEKLQGFRDEAKNKGAFKGPGGQEALARIDGLLKVVKGLTDTGQDNVDDWKKIVSSVKTIYGELSQFSAKVSKLSPELDKLYEGLRKKEAQINEWSKKKIAGIDGRAEVGRKIKSTSESEQISFHKISKKGNIGKSALVDPETILRNYKEGSLALRNKDGQEITDQGVLDKYLKDLSAEYEKHTNEVENAKVKINELSTSIDQLNSKIQKQIGIEQTKGTGSDGGELLAQIEGSSHEFNKAANKSLEDAATKNEKSTKIDPSTVKVANQAAGSWSKAFKALSLYTVAMRGLKTACQSAVKTVAELDKYLTEQAMVTGKSRKETYGLLKSYQDLAAQCGATTKEIAEVSTEYLKQGKSIQEAMTLTEAAVKAAKVARVSVGDSVNYLTTALNGFQLSANDAMKVSDKFAAVAAASATDYDELAIALSKVASQANLAGMSIDYTTALLTKGLETTREAPETMGTALKTIIARMRELSDYGETLDDGMDINNVESQLKYVGIALRDSNGELRSTEEVLDELGQKWDGLNKNQQAALAKALAGTRQQSRLIALMDGYERVTELQQIAQRSQGATAAQADTYLEGMEAAINNVKVAWEKVTMAFTDSDAIIKIVDKVADAITIVGDVLDTTAGQVGVFGTIAGISAVVLGNKMREHYYAKEQQRLDKEDALLKVQQAKEEQANLIEQEKAKIRIRHEERAASIEQAGLDKINALENRSAQLEELKLIAKQKIEGHKQAIQEKENLIIQIEENRMEQENLLLDIERNKEFFKRLAAEAEAAGNTEAARQWADQYNASAAAYTKEQQQYEAADYSGQISKQEHSISGHKGTITKIEKEIAGYDQEQQTIPGQIQQVVSDTKKEMGKEEEALQKDLQSEQFQEQISGAQQAIELLTKQEELLKAQLSPINAITSGITGWISPLKSFANGIQNTIKGVGNLIGKLKNIGSTSKKNEKQLKKETKELKNSKKALKDTSKESKKAADAKKQETKASQDNVKVEKQEIGVNYQEAASEGVAAAGTKASSEADKQEAQQNMAATETDVAESAANTGEAVTEGAAAATSGLAAAADAKEARDSIKAAKADAVESMGNVTEALTGSAESASKIPYVGWIIALGLLAAAGIAVGVSMANVNGAFDNDYGAEKKAENINKLSGEIYELTERARALDNITDSFQDIDDKVIKTKKDIEEMNSLLEQAGDELSDEIEEDEDIGYGKGVSAKEAYAALSREEDKVAFLEAEAERNRQLANAKRQEQLEIFNSARSYEKTQLLYGKDAQYVNARSAIYGINNNTLYERIDALKDLPNADEEALASTEALVQSMLNELDITRALAIANEDSGRTIQNLISTLSGLEATEEFMNEDVDFKDRVQAFRELTNELQGNQEMLAALKEAYSEWDTFANMDDSILNFIDTMGLSIDEINELYAGYKDLQKAGMEITKEEYEGKMNSVMSQLDGDLSHFDDIIKANFADVLATADNFDDAWNTIISSIGDTFATGILDMGQHMDKFKNTINSFYETAANWGEMTESEKMEFITENQDLFAGEGGEEMLKAFQSGNYEMIESALSQQMSEKTQQQLEEVRRTLAVEEARVGEDRNEAYIASLREYEEYLTNGDDLYKASLELRLEQEQKQLDEYRELLEKEREALEESLEKRKEAYEKYFDAVNQNEEDEDYEEQADLLINNLGKLGSASDPASQKQTKEMEKQLQELEEERLKELRERAQEAVIENIDDELAEISDKFDKLLESNHALLLAMQGDLEDPGQFIGDMLSKEIAEGKSPLEMEEYVDSLKATFGSVLGDSVDWEVLKEEVRQLFLNVNGQTINLNEGDQQSVYEAVEKALTQIGQK